MGKENYRNINPFGDAGALKLRPVKTARIGQMGKQRKDVERRNREL